MKYIEILSALLTPMIAVVTTYIMVQQYRVEKRNQRLQLYEMRNNIYESAIKLISLSYSGDKIRKEDLNTYLFSTRQSAHFFNKEVTEFLNELYKKICQLNAQKSIIEGRPFDDNRRQKAIDMEYELSIWFTEQPQKLNELCQEYLNFKKP